VRKQLACHPAQNSDIALQMQCCTVHTFSGPNTIHALQSKRIASVLVAEMSNAGSLSDDDFFSSYYAQATARLAKITPGVMGIVCQSRGECDAGDSIIYMTPGVHLDSTTDGGDQRYRDCHKAIAVQQNDMVIVGRGIHASSDDPLTSVKRYQAAAWAAHTGK